MLIGKATLNHASDDRFSKVICHDLLDAGTVKPAGGQFTLQEADDVAALNYSAERFLQPVGEPIVSATNIVGQAHRLQLAQPACSGRLLERIVVHR